MLWHHALEQLVLRLLMFWENSAGMSKRTWLASAATAGADAGHELLFSYWTLGPSDDRCNHWPCVEFPESYLFSSDMFHTLVAVMDVVPKLKDVGSTPSTSMSGI